ncbi:MAG: YciK family oxidoreductase [Gammaproteobacteria bacterium]|jgi:NAD(P)-dependent dehydrogenase (short-subunit alcohol dehydrogenase family)|nr:YciK family oxidoreductase [Gammaproteobacteria bacterium]MBT7369185.1 YciK family oxidoreductase [Gammaproteobacteria bacterium]
MGSTRNSVSYNPAPNILKDCIILITGAGDGIGRAVSIACARHGATVILLGRTTTKLEAVFDEIIDSGFPEPGIVPMDLATAGLEEISALAEVIDSRYGLLDGLLHNASILGERVPFDHYGIDQWQQVMQVNLNAVFLLTRILLPLLQRSDDSRLLFTSSGVGTTPRAYWGAYSVSKYATEGLAKLLADELANTSSVRVNIINPGATRTAMRAEAYPAEDPTTLKTPEDLLPLYLYLLGPDSQLDHGKTFTSDWLD